MTYQQPADLNLLPQARHHAPAEFEAFMGFHQAAFRDGGAIPRKYRELIGVAVGATAKCGYCVDTHTRGAIEAGASRAEITEAIFVAAAVSAGGTAAHSLLALRLTAEEDGAATP